MSDIDKSKEQLLEEIRRLRVQLAGHEAPAVSPNESVPELLPNAYQEFFDSIADAIGVIAMDGSVREANRAACELYGYSKDEIIGAPAIAVLDKAARYKMDEAFAAVREGKTQTVETLNWRKDGSKITTQVRISPVTFLGELHMMVVIRDVTEETRLRDRVFRSEAHFRQIADNVDEIMWLATLDGLPRMNYINRAFQEIYGVSEQEIYENPEIWFKTVHPDDQDRVARERYDMLCNGQTSEIKFRIIRPDNTIRWLHSRAFAIFDQDTNVERFVGIARDITREVDAEMALEASEKKRKLALEAAKVGVWEWDFSTNEIIFDPILMSMLGYPGEVSTMNLRQYLQLVHPDDLENDIKHIQDHMQGRTPEFETERRMLHNNGSYRSCLVRGHLVLDENRKPLRFVGTMMDIDNLKRVENSLRDKTRRLQTIRDILGIILKGDPLETTVDELLDRLKILVPYRRASVILIKNDRFGEVITAHSDLPSKLVKNVKIPLDEINDLTILRRGQVVVVKVLEQTEELSPLLSQLSREGIRSYVAAPLSSGKEFFGLLNVGSERENEFDDEAVEIIREVAVELAITIGQHRLNEQAHRRATALEALRQGTQDVTRRLDLESVLTSLARNVARIVNASATAIHILHKSGKYTELQVVHGDKAFYPSQKTSAGNCLVGKVWEENRAIIVDDYKNWKDSMPELRDQITGAAIGVPIIWGTEFKGVIVGVSEDVGAFSNQDRDQLELFASQASIAIRNAELYEELLKYQERLRRLASEVSLVEEQERRSLAAELHDHVGQSLAMAKNLVAQMKETVREPRLEQPLVQLNELLSQSIADIRSLIFEISPPVLYELGFEAAIEWLSEQMQEKHKLAIEFRDDDNEKMLDEDICIFMFKAVRELLINITKHANAQNVVISIQRQEEMMVLEIRDDGTGFDMSRIDTKTGSNTGFGLFNIRERAYYFGGAFYIHSESGVGTTVVLKAPLAKEDSGSLRFGSSASLKVNMTQRSNL